MGIRRGLRRQKRSGNARGIRGVLLTMDEQLKTSYNSIVLAHPTISSHWRKFKRGCVFIESDITRGSYLGDLSIGNRENKQR